MLKLSVRVCVSVYFIWLYIIGAQLVDSQTMDTMKSDVFNYVL